MHTGDSSTKTRFKVGIFTLFGIFAIGALTVYVNDKPYWYRPCQLVHISVDDATGLKTKSAVRSMGLEIGYLKNVELAETHVRLGICITAPVEVLPATRAYIRGEGFLGDKFVELKPVKYIGPSVNGDQDSAPAPTGTKKSSIQRLLKEIWIPEAEAAEPMDPAPSPSPAPAPASRPANGRRGREIPVATGAGDMQAVVGKVDQLVGEMTSLTSNLKQAIRPEELRETMRQLNKTLENASKTISPEGNLNQTAQRALGKLEDAIEQLRLIMTRINKGEGSLGMLVNDPVYAQEIKQAITNINKLLGNVSKMRFNVDVGGQIVRGYEGARAWFRLGIWPKRDRYYLLGVSVDPRGRRTKLKTDTVVAGGPSTHVETTQLEETGLLMTVMVGKVFWDVLDLAIGAFNGDGAVSVGLNLGPAEKREAVQIRQDIYARSGENSADGRLTMTLRPWLGAYVMGGLESYNRIDGKLPFFYGAGVSFDDEDIKILFALR